MPVAPRVSVVVPFLDPGEFLREAIESVLAQHGPSWELLLVDDGSSDASVQIARTHAQRMPDRIRVLRHSDGGNHGMAASRNLGIAHARGEFIASMDSDDAIAPDRLASQVAILDANPGAAFTFGPMRLWRSWNAGEDSWQRFECAPGLVEPPGFLPLLLSGRNDPGGCLLRTDAVRRVGGYEEAVHMCEDWTLYVKLLLRWAVYVDDRCTYHYRQHEGQSCSVRSRQGRFHADFEPFFRWFSAYLQAQGIDDARVLAARDRAVVANRLRRAGERLRRWLRPLVRPPRGASR